MIFDQPELFYTINYFPAFYFLKILFPVFWGLLLLPFIFLYKKKSFKKFKVLIYVFLALWLPSYAVSVYNSIYDVIEAYDVRDMDINKKRIIRMCNMDSRQNDSLNFCKIFSFVTFAKNSLTPDSKIKILAPDSYTAYLNYYLYSDFSLSQDLEGAEYVLMYLSYRYKYQAGYLVAVGANGESDKQFACDLKYKFDENKLILKIK